MPAHDGERSVSTQGGAFVQNSVHVQGGDFVGRDKVVINSVDDIVEALRKAGILSRVTTQIQEEQFRQLLEVVGRVTLRDAGARLYEACRAALSPTAHLVNSDDPYLLLANMCEQQRREAWPPIFECVERFAVVEGIDTALASDLQHWVDDCAALVNPATPPKDVERLRREVRAEAMKLAEADAPPSWLQVCLEPDWLNRTQGRKQPLFRVELVLWSPRTKGGLVLPSAPGQRGTGEATQLWTLDELPFLLDQVFLRSETVSLVPDMTRLVIEVVAPSDLLLYGFERWKRNKTEFKYGAYYALVVRLRDRLMIPNADDQKRADDYWHKKWNAFRNSVRYKGCEGLEWRAHEDLDAFELQDDEDLVCLGLSSPVLPEHREVFDTLRDAGVPIAVWIRGTDLGPCAPADWPQRMTKFVQGEPFSRLCETIKALRRSKEVRSDEAHFCNALTLLWDDPDRSPPKYDAQGVFV